MMKTVSAFIVDTSIYSYDAKDRIAKFACASAKIQECLICGCTAISLSGIAPQSVSAADPIPEIVPIRAIDDLGIDRLSMEPQIPAPEISSAGIRVHFSGVRAPVRNNFSNALIVSEEPITTLTYVSASFDGTGYEFYPVWSGSSWSFVPHRQTQATLEKISSQYYQLITSDGTVILYDTTFRSAAFPGILAGSNPDDPGGNGSASLGVAVKATRPNGEVIDYIYQPNGNGTSLLRSVKSSLGWIAKFETNYVYRPNIDVEPSGKREEPVNIYIINLAYDYCNPSSYSCYVTSTSSFPKISISTIDGIEFHYYDQSGQNIFSNSHNSYSFPSGLTYSFLPGCVGYCKWMDVDNVSAYGSIWNYSAVNNGGSGESSTITQTRSDANGNKSYLTYTYLRRVPLEYINELGGVERYVYDSESYLIKYALPEATYSDGELRGGYVEYTYDARRNIIAIKHYPKDGGVPAVQSFTYASSCDSSNFRVCNKPITIKNANGDITNYTYDAAHGGILTVTSPPDGNSVRAQKRYFYAQRYAWIKNSSGLYMKSSTPVWVLTSEEFCKATAASGNNCTGGSIDEVVINYDYGPESGPNNLLLRGKMVTDGSVTLRTCFTYDVYGRRISETRPNADLTACP